MSAATPSSPSSTPAPPGPRATGVPAVEVRAVEDDELRAWSRVQSRGLLQRRRLDDAEMAHRRRRYAGQRLRAAHVGGALVGTLRSWDLDLPVPGGTARAEAISSVAVATTHRRRGVLSAMLRTDLAAAAERGAALAVLVAAEAPIYGRFGFGASVEQCTQVLHTAGAFTAGEEDVDLELVLDTELRDLAPGVYARAAAGAPGSMPRSDLWWDTALGLVADPAEGARLPDLGVLARDGEGVAVGYAVHRVHESWAAGRPTSTMELLDLAATTPAAHAALWRHLAATDLVATIRAEHRPVHDPLPWLLADRRAARQVDRDDFLWVRVLDPVAALGARLAGAPGSGVVEVVDDGGPAGGRLRWEAGADGALTAAASRREPEVVLGAGALGSVLLGQVPLALLHAAGQVEERSAGAVARLGAALAWTPMTSPTLTSF